MNDNVPDPNLPPVSNPETKIEDPHLKGAPHHLETRLAAVDPELKDHYEKLVADKVNSDRNFKVASEQLRKAETKLNEIAVKEQDAERKRLEEQGEFKKLAEQAEARASMLEARLTQQTVQSSLNNELSSAGAVDNDLLATALMAKYGDELKANPEAASALVARLKEEKPLLFQRSAVQPTTKPTGPSGSAPPAAGAAGGFNALDKKISIAEVERQFDEAFAKNPMF